MVNEFTVQMVILKNFGIRLNEKLICKLFLFAESSLIKVEDVDEEDEEEGEEEEDEEDENEEEEEEDEEEEEEENPSVISHVHSMAVIQQR